MAYQLQEINASRSARSQRPFWRSATSLSPAKSDAAADRILDEYAIKSPIVLLSGPSGLGQDHHAP